MKKISIFIFLIFLISCSAQSTQTQKNTINYTTLRLVAPYQLTASFNGKEYHINPYGVEEIPNVIEGQKYNITAWNDASYRTITECEKTCKLKLDLRGSLTPEIIESTNTSFNFIINKTGDVRNGFFCIAYENIWFKGINAQSIDIPASVDKTQWDKCYQYQEGNISINLERGQGTPKVLIYTGMDQN